jgi:hypothetical protein
MASVSRPDKMCLPSRFTSLMTSDERSEMQRLVLLIQDEKDHNKFMELITQLNELLGRKEHRLEERKPSPSTQC